jgi:hypothetical protein
VMHTSSMTEMTRYPKVIVLKTVCKPRLDIKNLEKLLKQSNIIK